MFFTIHIKSIPLYVFFLFLIACGESDHRQSVEVKTSEEIKQQEEALPAPADASFADGMTEKAFQNYLQLRTSLVRSDAEAAQIVADNLADTFDDKYTTIKELAQKIATTTDIEAQRRLFSELTLALEPIVKDNLTSGTVYVQYCPMAFNNEGAYWFSEIEEIRNPYFGDKMLKCGRVDDEISK